MRAGTRAGQQQQLLLEQVLLWGCKEEQAAASAERAGARVRRPESGLASGEALGQQQQEQQQHAHQLLPIRGS